MKKMLIKIIMCVVVICLVSGNSICFASDVETNDENDISMILEAICENNFEDGDVIDVNGKFTIRCEVKVEKTESNARNAYSSTDTATKKFVVIENSTTRELFSITQTVVAVFNTYTEKAMITSHTASFNAIDPSYSMRSCTQKCNLNTWNEMTPGILDIVIAQGSSTGMVRASVTVRYCDKFSFSFAQIY